MPNPTGFAAVGLVGLWIAYLVPHRLRHRQQLLESRTEDRFSEALRVLAVTDRPGLARRSDEARAECSLETVKRVELLTAGRGIGIYTSGVTASMGARVMDRPHGRQEKISADAARRRAADRAQHAAMLGRRAAAARRRAALTAVLLVATAGAWAVVGFVSVVAWVAVAPSVLLVGTLVLGRRAVLAGQRSDAVWRARALEPSTASSTGTAAIATSSDVVASRTASTVTGGPARIGATGRAVRSSDFSTQVIERITDDMAAPGTTPAGRTRSLAAPVGDDEQEWAPVPVPRPTYTFKAEAPRWEPAPLEPADVAPMSAPGSAAAGSGTELADAASQTRVAVGGLDLDTILARRRASGE